MVGYLPIQIRVCFVMGNRSELPASADGFETEFMTALFIRFANNLIRPLTGDGSDFNRNE